MRWPIYVVLADYGLNLSVVEMVTDSFEAASRQVHFPSRDRRSSTGYSGTTITRFDGETTGEDVKPIPKRNLKKGTA